ncbi:MAG: MATE family efflux transporter [Sphaerochaetaceae bacterium]|nr:MATE family efflux transporter [Sphaerochaetaceae bacterium]
MRKSKDLTKGSVLGTLVSFAIPFFIANALQQLYGIVDLFVVGKYSSTSAIAAVSIGTQVLSTATFLITGLSMGTTVSIANSVGAGDEKRTERTISTSYIIFSVFALFLTLLMVLFSAKMAMLMKTPTEALASTVDYLRICSLGVPFIVLYNVNSAIFRGLGDSRTPMVIVALTCVINIFGDVLLTGYMGLGALGVALATTISQLICSLISTFLLLKRKYKLSRKIDRKLAGNILYIGLPIAAQDTLIHLSFIFLTVIANSRGLIASSAVGIVERIIASVFLVPSAMLSSTSAITAQCVGHQDGRRAVKSMWYAVAISFVYGLFIVLLCNLNARILITIFTKDEKVIISATEYIATYSLDIILVAFVFPFNGYLCGTERTIIPFIHSVISAFGVRIPAAYIFSQLYPESLAPMGLASPLGSVVSILIIAIYFIWRRFYFSK